MAAAPRSVPPARTLTEVFDELTADELTTDELAANRIGSRNSDRDLERALSVAGVTHDSRRVAPGWIFCCVPGERADGHDFAQTAVDAGAIAIVVQRPITTVPPVPQLLVADVRASLGAIASAAYGHPARQLVMVGVTGTNGKTSTAHMLAEILTAAGHRTEVIGTLTQTRTTPEATDLHEHLAKALADGATHVVMEVTSHALVLGRVAGIRYDLAGFTNLSQDHLDFHGSMEEYFRAKALLFTPEYTAAAVVNGDDPYGRLLSQAAVVPTTTFGFADAQDLEVGAVSRFSLRGVPVTLPIGGRFSVANALCASALAHHLGIADAVIAAGLANVHVPGRFETINAGQPMAVVVDYAHTPDGLQRVLESARAMTTAPSRVITVFGCGGDRDRTKRPLMGQIAAELSDLAIVTSDNPRSEQPNAIIDDILAGIRTELRGHVAVDGDRRSAIRFAITSALAGDTVVIAGKGHEQGQDIGGVVSPFDDRVVTTELLHELNLIGGDLS
jgi:UDP-N-acetylmuramoyl-L-alanyl-D-glutamate--2,6-diaminopimelate ligase